MSRFGWSSREPISPFNSSLGSGGVPDVTEDDFSYITSEDLENDALAAPRHRYDDYDRERSSSAHHFGRSAPRSVEEAPEDDILLIHHKRGVTFPEHFPAYSIGDGKLLVCDVRDRIRLAMKLTEREARRARLLYKGHHMKESTMPVREYGVKDNSEILVDISGDAESSSESGEEIVVVSKDNDAGRRRRQKKRGGKKRDGEGDGDRSPQDSGSNVGSTVGTSAGLDVPRGRGEGRAGSTSRGQSAASGVSGASAAAAVPGGPIDKLNSIGSHFTTKLLPLCIQFTAKPPADSKKREDEHRKLSETVMQQVLLKLDEVETGGDEEARGRRRELVRQVQEALKGLDARLQEMRA